MPFALVGYEVIITNSRYALVGYFITSYPTRAHGIIVIKIVSSVAACAGGLFCVFEVSVKRIQMKAQMND